MPIEVKGCGLSSGLKVVMTFDAYDDFRTSVISVVLLVLLDLDSDVNTVWEVIKKSHSRISGFCFPPPPFSPVTLQIIHPLPVQPRHHSQNLLIQILQSSMPVVVAVAFCVLHDSGIVSASFQRLPMPEHFWPDSHTKKPNRPFLSRETKVVGRSKSVHSIR
jgi:hypothetical protein